MKEYRAVVLTGASGGIGLALVDTLAAPGMTFLLVGRDTKRLDVAAADVTRKGAQAEICFCDITDRIELSKYLVDFDRRHAVDLVIANAGMTARNKLDRFIEDNQNSQRIIDVNLTGVVNTVEPLLPAMIARREGQIAIVSSVAALRPHADLPSYSAAKSGVRAYGIALRGLLRDHKVAVSVITPGFVKSPMSARHLGPKPFELSAEKAAMIIANGLKGGKPMISFPWQLIVLARLGNLLPVKISDWLERRFAAEIISENDDVSKMS